MQHGMHECAQAPAAPPPEDLLQLLEAHGIARYKEALEAFGVVSVAHLARVRICDVE
jgi:hypothetical protein